jgi:site-specific recombinase
MGYGAIGAGVITAFTALFKYIFSFQSWAPLWIGVAHSLNYAISFVLMQQLGWPLASKMPAMTASALANAMEQGSGMREEVRLIAAISRSQFIVTFGNIFGAVPMSLLIDFVIQWRTGHPFLSESVALHGMDSMRLLRSWTIPFAALTGCFLWISSLAAGWTGNWVVLNRLPTAIQQSERLARWFSPSTRAKIAAVFEEDLSGAAGYACLGLLFGLLPFLGAFAGAPIEVRHITLASASLTYDIRSLVWYGHLPFDVFWALLGLVATGLLNFDVSFALGLWLAMRAKNLGLHGRRTLALALWAEMRRDPVAFFWKGFPATVGVAPVAVDPPIPEEEAP